MVHAYSAKYNFHLSKSHRAETAVRRIHRLECENGSSHGGIGSLCRAGNIGRLRFLLIRFPFNLLHDVLKVGPFCRSDDLKLKAELPLAAPPDNRCLNVNGRFELGDLDSNLESGSWLYIDGTFDATPPYGEIQKAPLSTDQSDGGK